MKPSLVSIIFAMFLGFQAAAGLAANNVETLVFVRHGEKPSDGLGQITCQGLNRALALPQRLARYGTPDEIFAPNPTTKVRDPGGDYFYVRPIATIEPTAIKLGMPINTRYGFTEIDQLKQKLLDDSYNKSLLFIAWEHVKLEAVVRSILQDIGGNDAMVPHWPNSDYDSIYLITITSDANGNRNASFRQDFEGLNNQSNDCFSP